MDEEQALSMSGMVLSNCAYLSTGRRNSLVRYHSIYSNYQVSNGKPINAL